MHARSDNEDRRVKYLSHYGVRFCCVCGWTDMDLVLSGDSFSAEWYEECPNGCFDKETYELACNANRKD